MNNYATPWAGLAWRSQIDFSKDEVGELQKVLKEDELGWLEIANNIFNLPVLHGAVCIWSGFWARRPVVMGH